MIGGFHWFWVLVMWFAVLAVFGIVFLENHEAPWRRR